MGTATRPATAPRPPKREQLAAKEEESWAVPNYLLRGAVWCSCLLQGFGPPPLLTLQGNTPGEIKGPATCRVGRACPAGQRLTPVRTLVDVGIPKRCDCSHCMAHDSDGRRHDAGPTPKGGNRDEGMVHAGTHVYARMRMRHHRHTDGCRNMHSRAQAMVPRRRRESIGPPTWRRT
jgi:hypothetical protein